MRKHVNGVRVIELRSQPPLTKKALSRRVVVISSGQHLKHDQSTVEHRLSLEHDTHPTLSELADNAEINERGAGKQLRRMRRCLGAHLQEP